MDGRGKNGITNGNSIGVEICINADGVYDLTERNTIDLVYKLMVELNIPLECVVRHYDASGKICPGSMKDNDWFKWKKFKDKLKEVIIMNEAPKHFAQDSFDYAKENGIIIKETRFSDPITRGEIFVLIAQVLKFVIANIGGAK